MSESPLLSKMDALLKKHRGGAGTAPPEASAAPPSGAWLPVLTDVIERGAPPVVEVSAPAPTGEEPAAVAEPPAAAVEDTLAEQLMSELAPRLSDVMEKQVAAELRKNIDQTVSTLLAQLDVNVREIVRDAVAERLKHPRDPSA